MKKTATRKLKRSGQSSAGMAGAGSEKKSFPIVGIGASAGGLDAFTRLLHHLPADIGMAFVLVQHLDPDHKSALATLLARTTPLPVIEVTNKIPVKPNHVFIIPPNT
jgi:two-component system, chemotaxis family, CheB/CheR fusion protein